MNKIMDRLMMLALSFIVFYFFVQGNLLLVFVYSSIFYSAINYALLSRDEPGWKMRAGSMQEKIAFMIELIMCAFVLFCPPAIILMPVISYDLTKSRNYIGATIGVLGIINAPFNSYLVGDYTKHFAEDGVASYIRSSLFLYVILLCIISVTISIRTEQRALLIKSFRRLRDDSAESRERLRAQNVELINAKDSEVYTAQLAERNRIAREIHDNVGHMLSRALLQMGALLSIYKEEPMHAQLESVRETLDAAMNNIRSSVHDLHSESIDVKENIEQMTEPLQDKFKVNLDIDVSSDVARQIKYAVIGITKEAISNIIKHSSNNNVDIRFDEHPSMYQLIIHDYAGDAFGNRMLKRETAKVNDDVGIGLENIQSRVESVGGTLLITRENGFRIFVTIPK